MKTRRLAALLKKIPVWRAIEAEVRSSGRTAYLVGGAVRDLLLGRKSTTLDLDIAVPGSAERLAGGLARRLGGKPFALHDVHRIWRVALPKAGYQVDVAELQGDDILQDLARRDFTLNALALPIPAEEELLDPYGGLADLRRRKLRAVSPRAFREDPLRLLRLFRLCGQLGLAPEARTLAWARAHRKRIRTCAGERVRAELLAILSAPDAARWLDAMDEAGLLTAVFPELEASRRCALEYYGKGGVLRHALDTVARMDFLLPNLSRIYPGLADAIRPKAPQAGLLRLAALLHDVAKPSCARRMGGRLRFFGHDSRGARMSARILERLRFSNDEVRTVDVLVAQHLRPGNLAASGVVSDKAVYRFFRDLGGYGVKLLLLCWADHASYLTPRSLVRVVRYVGKDPHVFDPARVRPQAVRKTLYHLQVISYLLKRYVRKPETARPKRLLDGHEVMKALRLESGPRIGEILGCLEEAQAEGRVKTRGEALRFISRL